MNCRPNNNHFINMFSYLFGILLLVLFVCCSGEYKGLGKQYKSWTVAGGSKENIKYADLQQVDTQNVKDLEVAWIYHSEGADSLKFSPRSEEHTSERQSRENL